MKNNIWKEIQKQIAPRAEAKTSSYWFNQVCLLEKEGNEKQVVLVFPSVFVKDSFEKRFGKKVLFELKKRGFVEGYTPTVDEEFFPKEEETSLGFSKNGVSGFKEGFLVEDKPPKDKKPFNLSVFNDLCVGSSNNLAFVAAKTIVEEPGDRFNPLFLYGKPGVGKTHLLKTIEKSRRDAFYIGSEDYLNSFIKGIKYKNLDIFKQKLRKNAILLFDDLQFLVGKKAASEEFLNTLNHYIEEKRAIVMVSDVRPEDLTGFPERLVSRIYSGLVTDIDKPDKGVLFSYLKKESEGLNIKKDLLTKISSHPFKNFREVDGFLNSFSANSYANNDPSFFVERFLKDSSRENLLANKNPEELLSFVSERYQVDEKLLLSKNRSEKVAKARHVLVALLRKNTSLSLKQIGLFVGGRSHSTVLSSLRKVEGDKDLSTDLNNLSIEKKVG